MLCIKNSSRSIIVKLLYASSKITKICHNIWRSAFGGLWAQKLGTPQNFLKSLQNSGSPVMLIESQKVSHRSKQSTRVPSFQDSPPLQSLKCVTDRRPNTCEFYMYRLIVCHIVKYEMFLVSVFDYNMHFTLNKLVNKERREVLKWQLFYRKKVVIHVPLQIKKIHHTHTIYKIFKEPHHEEHGGQGGRHGSLSWHWWLLCFSYNWTLCLSTIVPRHFDLNLSPVSLYVRARCCLLPWQQ